MTNRDLRVIAAFLATELYAVINELDATKSSEARSGRKPNKKQPKTKTHSEGGI